jgi:hypothetical protein
MGGHSRGSTIALHRPMMRLRGFGNASDIVCAPHQNCDRMPHSNRVTLYMRYPRVLQVLLIAQPTPKRT